MRQIGLWAFSDPSQLSKAQAYLEQNLQIHRALGNALDEGKAWNALGIMAIRIYDLQTAKSCLEKGLHLCQITGNSSEEAYALSSLCFLMYILGQYPDSTEYLS